MSPPARSCILADTSPPCKAAQCKNESCQSAERTNEYRWVFVGKVLQPSTQVFGALFEVYWKDWWILLSDTHVGLQVVHLELFNACRLLLLAWLVHSCLRLETDETRRDDTEWKG
eukprot:4598828-Karenia_brevis.AAC.1